MDAPSTHHTAATRDLAAVNDAGRHSADPARSSGDLAGPPDASRTIVFFDGVCGLCNWFVDFALPRDRHRRLLFAPLQGETARGMVDRQDRESLKTVVVVDRQGAHRRSSAVVRVLRQLGGGWSVLGMLLWLVPKPIRDLAYQFVARNRYRWFGQKEACRMPTPEERSRFLP